jgi:murein DD-endopeptidase MepM/ murein hydrolase activator NlpD
LIKEPHRHRAPNLTPPQPLTSRRTDFARPLGNEPPLEIGAPTTALKRAAVNKRWLGASFLTGVAGAGLLGAAIYVSSHGEINFAAAPERMPAGIRPSDEGAVSLARKGDKLVRVENTVSAKQSFRSPVTLRVGEREVIKVRSFMRIATNLSMTSGVYATDIPPFNPMRFFSEAGPDRAPEPAPETSDAEVSVVKSDLSTSLIELGGPALNDADVAGQVSDLARTSDTTRPAVLPPASPPTLSRTLSGAPSSPPATFGRAFEDPFRSLDVRVVPENVTAFVKSAPRAPELSFEERQIPIRRGDGVDLILRQNGASADDVRAIGWAIGGRDRNVANEGETLRILIAPAPSPGAERTIMRVILVGERGIVAIAARNDRGAFVSVTPAQEPTPRPEPGRGEATEDEDERGGVSLYNSLYETAFKQDLPRQTVDDLVRIFGYDVDFQRRVQPGDSIELFFANDDESGAERLDILYAALTLGSEARRVYRFQSPDDGSVDFFDEAGRSLKKFLLRKPILEARLTSGFGTRFHPILGYAKMHSGVDWANKSGTPILAAGNGTVAKAEWDSGYGRRIELQHANGYVTTYNHMSAFARGMSPGARVRQGQVIGYVGSTGLSTGAHLHYEVIVNGHFVDPMKIRVPRGRELDGRALADFSRQREQTDALMLKAGSPNRFAQREAR